MFVVNEQLEKCINTLQKTLKVKYNVLSLTTYRTPNIRLTNIEARMYGIFKYVKCIRVA